LLHKTEKVGASSSFLLHLTWLISFLVHLGRLLYWQVLPLPLLGFYSKVDRLCQNGNRSYKPFSSLVSTRINLAHLRIKELVEIASSPSRVSRITTSSFHLDLWTISKR
jgi:hypothetical protein